MNVQIRYHGTYNEFLGTSRSAVHTHFTGRHCNPLVLGGIEPRQPKRVLAVDVDMLAVRVPPATLVVPCTVCVRYISITVNR